MTEPVAIVAGVDTHADTHYAAMISTTGEHLCAAQFAATEVGYRALAAFITCRGPLRRVGVEGTNSYGAGLARHLRAVGVEVVEVIRPARQVRRMRGKSDEIDAYAAAHIALADVDTVTPKTAAASVEAIRVINVARRGAVKSRSETIQQIKSLLVTAPETIRAECRGLSTARLVARLAGWRARAGDDPVAAHTRTAQATGRALPATRRRDRQPPGGSDAPGPRGQPGAVAGQGHRCRHRRAAARHGRGQPRPDRL